MSADNWTTCPACADRRNREIEAEITRVKDQYGMISPDEYIRQIKEVETRKEEEDVNESMREDYEIGIDGGVFTVDYRASCTKCGYGFSYKFKQGV